MEGMAEGWWELVWRPIIAPALEENAGEAILILATILRAVRD